MAHNDDLDIKDEDVDMYDEEGSLDETGEKGGRITSADETYMDDDVDDEEGFFDDLDMDDEDYS